jgi:hypothetical protein
MSQNETRLYATIAIWSALAVMGVAAMVTRIQLDGGALVALFFVLIIGAAGGTAAVWNSGNAKQEAVDEAEKAKRRSKVERLVEKLDEQELDELRARLMAENDGEALSLDELMQESGRQHR